MEDLLKQLLIEMQLTCKKVDALNEHLNEDLLEQLLSKMQLLDKKVDAFDKHFNEHIDNTQSHLSYILTKLTQYDKSVTKLNTKPDLQDLENKVQSLNNRLLYQ